ncbi:MAG: hypothetical protein QXY05_02340 [Candidatus Anstonellales archaeon]
MNWEDTFQKFAKSNVQFSLLVILLVLYLVTKHIFFAILTLLSFILMLASEVYFGVKKHGIRHEIMDTIVAIIFALVVWYGASFLLNTSSPISAVVSCSMLPAIQRGDLIIVQGVSDYAAYELNITQADYSALLGHSEAVHGDKILSVKGSVFSFCQAAPDDPFCYDFATKPEEFSESRGNFVFQYGRCQRRIGADVYKEEPCIMNVSYKNKTYPIKLSHDIIVYQPNPNDVFALYGDIIHRAYFKLNVDGKTYYLTKGDNNNLLDIQYYSYYYERGNMPVPADRVKGKDLFQIPFLGYYKLFLSMMFSEDPQCNTILIYPHE